jgi:hypothetical protein
MRSPRPRVASEVEQEVGRLYLSGKTVRQCAGITSLAYNTIRKILRRTQVLMRPKGVCRRTPRADAILADFCGGAKPSAIARKYGVSISTVRNVVLRAGLAYPSRGQTIRRYTVNEVAFDVLDDEVAYWLGFLLADGGISLRSVLRVNVSARDCGHLESLRGFLRSTAPIGTGKASAKKGGRKISYCYLAVCSQAMVVALGRWGITPKKSLTAVPHDLLVGMPDFWRGVVDGDGCLYWHCGQKSRPRPVLIVVGTEAVCRAFATFAASCGATGRKSVAKRRNIWEVRLYGSDARLLAELLYSRSGPMLVRKKVLAESFRVWRSQAHGGDGMLSPCRLPP